MISGPGMKKPAMKMRDEDERPERLPRVDQRPHRLDAEVVPQIEAAHDDDRPP